MTSEIFDPKRLVVPVYIDTNALLDLLASIQDGFSLVEKVTVKGSEGNTVDRSVKGESNTDLGISGIINLLKLNVAFTSLRKQTSDTSEERQAERTHTFGSLFHTLYTRLDSENLIKRIDSIGAWEQIKQGDFVEIQGLFRLNPAADTIRTLVKTIDLFLPFSNTPTPTGKNKSQQDANNNQPLTKDQIKKFNEALKGIVNDLDAGSVKIYVIDVNSDAIKKSVALLTVSHFRDQSSVEINHREYRMLGKVVRKIENENETVDLLVGTGMGGIGRTLVSQLFTSLSQTNELNLPNPEIALNGPMLEILPISVFV